MIREIMLACSNTVLTADIARMPCAKIVSKETSGLVAKHCWVATIGAIVPLAPVDSKALLLI